MPHLLRFQGRALEGLRARSPRKTSNVKYVIAYDATTGKWAFASYKVIPLGDLDTNGGTTADSNTITVYQFLSATNSGAA